MEIFRSNWQLTRPHSNLQTELLRICLVGGRIQQMKKWKRENRLFGKERRRGKILVGPKHFPPGPTKNLSPNWRENKHKSLLLAQLPNCPNLLSLSLTLLLFCFFCTATSPQATTWNNQTTCLVCSLPIFFFFFVSSH